MEIKDSKDAYDDDKDGEDKYWRCCSGGIIDNRLLTYIIQVLFSVISLFFCMFKLTTGTVDEDDSVWISIMSAIIGNFMPNVAHYNSNNKQK